MVNGKMYIIPLMKSRYVPLSLHSLKFVTRDGWESYSDEEDGDSDGEWIDVHHSSDEEQVCIGLQREKTCLCGFRQSELQTSLLSYRD